MLHDAKLKDVLYVPDASVHLFSVKAVAQNSYSTTLNEKEIVICRGDVAIAALGKLVNDLYVLVIQVCILRHAAEVHLVTQVETLGVWHERLGHQNKRHVTKVLKQNVLMWKQTKNFVMAVLWEKHIGRASELGQVDQA
jgi:hypothetical protein